MLDSRIAATPGPEESTEKADLIRLTLIRLSFKQRQCLVLHFEGFSPCEIAAMIDVSPASVGTYVSMARKRFRAIYQELENESGGSTSFGVREGDPMAYTGSFSGMASDQWGGRGR